MLLVAALSGWLAPLSRAHASGFDIPQVGAARFSPVTVDATAVHNNPGQLGFLPQAELDATLGLVVGSVGYERQRRAPYQFADNFDFAEPIAPQDIDPSKTGTARGVRSTPVGPTVGVFGAVPVVRDRLVLGLGFYIPYAAILDFPSDGPQRWQLDDITLASTHTTFSAGVRAHDVISLGAGITYVASLAQLRKVQDFGAVDVFGQGLEQPPINQPNDFGAAAPSTVRELDALARPVEIRSAWSHSVSFNVGVALRPTDRLDLAFVYQHGSKLRLRGDFAMDMNDDLFTQDLAGQGLQFPPVVEGEAEIRMELPKRVIGAVGVDVHPRVRLEVVGQYVLYQSFDQIDIELRSPDLAQPTLGIGETVSQPLVRDWMDTGHVELTGKFALGPKLGLQALVGYQSPASPDRTIDLASPDGHRIVFGAGVGYAFGERFTLLADFEGQVIAPRTVTTSDYDLGNGRYDLFLGQLGVTGQVRFGWPERKRPSPSGEAETAEHPAPPAG